MTIDITDLYALRELLNQIIEKEEASEVITEDLSPADAAVSTPVVFVKEHNPITRVHGKILYGLRLAADLTQTELAEKAGVSPTAVCNWENETASPTLRNLKKVCAALGVDHTKLLR
jgi:DNA-binding XRE family transcriptional regulator